MNETMRFEGWRWLLVPMACALLLAGMLGTWHSIAAAYQRDRLLAHTFATAIAAQETQASVFSDSQLEAWRQATPRIASIRVRDAQGVFTREAVATRPDPGLWERLLPKPVVAEAALVGADTQVPSQPPAVQVTLTATHRDPGLQRELLRIWIGLVLSPLLLWPVLRRARQAIALRHRPLMMAARALSQGRTETGVPGLDGVSGEIADAVRRALRHLRDLEEQHRQRLEPELNSLRQGLAQERARLATLNEELNSARDRLRLRDRLIGSLGHELRSPLLSVLSHAELMLASHGLRAEQTETLHTLKDSARFLLQITGDLLDWSRAESGGIPLQSRAFDIQETVEDTLRQLAPLACRKSLELVHLIYHDVPPRLVGDPDRLRQLLGNLLSNAIKYTAQGEVVLRVMHERDEEGDRCRIGFRVSDTGPGIPAEQLPRLFLPFQRLGETRDGGGAGLGLAISRHLSERMGGEIRIESTPGRGSDFQATLLFGKDRTSAPEVREGLRGRRIGILDGNATARLAARHYLEWWGAQVETVAGQEEWTRRTPASRAGMDAWLVSVVPEDLQSSWLGTLLSEAAPALLRVASASPQDLAQAQALGARLCIPKHAGTRTLYESLCRIVNPDTGTAREPQEWSGRRVLLADDNPANRLQLRQQLTAAGLSVREAVNGIEAVQACLQDPPDFALLDAHMPGIDGAAAAREIRARCPSRIPVVIMSAHLEPEELSLVTLAGADAVLIKPFNLDQLARALSPVLGIPRTAPAPLTADAELRALLRSELPEQLQKLQEALGAADPESARQAAHVFHGTCAFYHLGPLRESAAAIEKRLIAGERPDPAELGPLRQQLGEVLKTI